MVLRVGVMENNRDRDGGRMRRRRIKGTMIVRGEDGKTVYASGGVLFISIVSVVRILLLRKGREGEEREKLLALPLLVTNFPIFPNFLLLLQDCFRLSLETTSTSEVKLCEIARCRSYTRLAFPPKKSSLIE